MMNETIYESPLYLNEKQEDIIVALTSEINILVSNNPGIDFEGLSLHILNLLLLMDHLNSEFKSKEEELQTLRVEIKILESRLDLEKDIRQEEMDTSFKVQDQSTSEILSLNKRIESLQAALRKKTLIKVKTSFIDWFYNNTSPDRDSMIRYASISSCKRGAIVECCPGGKIKEIKEKLLKYENYNLSVIYFHVGTNNLKMWYRGRAGYNGGHGKREVLHDLANLLFTTKTHFPNTMVFVNSLLVRSDLTYRALFDFNEQVKLMCNNFDVVFVEANCWVKRHHLEKDGRNLKKTGNYQLGKLFLSVFTPIGDRIQGFLTVDANLDINESILVSDKTILSKTAQSKPSVVPPTANSSFLEAMSRGTV
ncbi:hypothetical protein J6590_068183 [Homalodisca vitripennis]|nr:hypothetical protein J6590_068183 [Homalodisca vitripennis]